jgi:serine phosphatase RsbU (regulator of sigma subunit)
LKRKENYVLFAAADSTGHGVPGAFMSLLGIAFLNEISIRIFNSGIDIKNLKASDILNDLRNQLKFALHQTQESATSRDGMDIALCVFNTETNVLHYAGAYNPLILIRNNKLNDIKADKMPIGIYINEKESFTNHEIQLQSNDCIYIFSDGFSDQFGGVNGRKFYSKNFKDLLRNNHQLPMKEQKENISHIIQSWMKNPIHESKIYEQVDDMLVIGIRI